MNARDRREGRRDERRRGRAHWSLPLYAGLLLLYPPSLRRAYGGDMLQTFRDTLREEMRIRGGRGALRAWSVALGDLPASLAREWPRELRRARPLDGQPPRWVRRYLARARPYRRTGFGMFSAMFSFASGRRARIGAELARRRPMNEKFDKFTERGRRVLSLAQEEAQRFNHNYIGTEHLLLGLIREEEGLGARALVALGVGLEQAREKVEFIIGRGDRLVLGDIGLTPRAKKVVELAVDEARRLNHHYIGTEHLLLGLVREGEGIAAGVLESLGVSLERARAEVMAMVATPGAASATAAPSALGLAVPYLTLVCRDVEATAAYYVEALGARVTPAYDANERALAGDGRMLRLPMGGAPGAGMLLALRAATPEEVAATLATAVGAVALRFVTPDAAALHRTLSARGVAGLSALTEVPSAPNIPTFSLTDPDGRLLRFQGIVRRT